ncbi:hypothetical protein ACGFRG_00515 [Streptomyces sp. NPDC048696]|uniref:hypothetical protein n=1 Tax=Streptomyces sp. NPDC048696 TaxID=3365585 RepID=UPI00372146A6
MTTFGEIDEDEYKRRLALLGPDGKINEASSLGEASRGCGAGEGNGIAPGALAWTTLTLRPGRYELVCNLPGHYLAGMYTDVTSR